MAYITYEDLCDQFTSKYIDDTFKDVDIINRERIITLFSAEVESWASKTLTPLKIFQPSSLRSAVQKCFACSVFDKNCWNSFNDAKIWEQRKYGFDGAIRRREKRNKKKYITENCRCQKYLPLLNIRQVIVILSVLSVFESPKY